jgi:hypothetical protein
VTGSPPRRVRCVSNVGGRPCKKWAIAGAVVCTAHGGRTPNIKKAAAMKLAEEHVRREIQSLRDVAPLTSLGDIYDDLLEVAGVCRAWRLVLQDRVSYLTNLHTAETEHTGEQVRADVLLFERALERSAKVGEMLARLNLDERRQAIDELDLGADMRERAKVAVVTRLRELA